MTELDTFELFPVKYGSGKHPWIGVHVKVKTWNRPAGFEDKNGMICLTADAQTSDELDAYIDELIAELQVLKQVGRRKMFKAVP
ncbi:MAG: hypothetical protein QOK17_2669 [Sphingomonadales bacterium]|jgi:hypothetical protein|nr:hypothetical protein [Sphingomonadales bacterium]